MPLLLLPLLTFVFSNVDYRRVDGGRRPLFSIPSVPIPDGGSVRWRGLGYDLISMHQLLPLDVERATGYTVGPVLEYWIAVWPFQNRENTRYEAIAAEKAGIQPAHETDAASQRR